MDIIVVPDLMIGEDKGDVNILFYKREDGPDQIKLKINYSQNMLCFMVKGTKEVMDDSDNYVINDQQIALVTSGSMLMTERVTLFQQFESLLLFFSNDFLESFLKKYQISVSDGNQDIASVISFPKDPYLNNFQESMLILRNDFNRKNFRVAKMEEVLLYLYEKYPKPVLGFISRAATKQENRSLVKVIQNHLFDNMSSQELAFLCNMSISTFRRKFLEVYQMPPKRYIIMEKMKQAAYMLRNRRKPSEIYFQLGYENLSSFSLEFKKHYGVSPTGYA
ncbi:MAG: helix-turn-helix transcriptional regulator [Saprospiraceae bacterium]|nr:helix-turn-helix transcriptional regulator [Saprospiraceae bacterium]